MSSDNEALKEKTVKRMRKEIDSSSEESDDEDDDESGEEESDGKINMKFDEKSK